MKEISEELRDEIIELFFSDLIDKDWSQSPPVYDLDNCAQLDIEIEPKDAKSINKIKQFKIIQTVMGSATTKCIRNNYERSK